MPPRNWEYHSPLKPAQAVDQTCLGGDGLRMERRPIHVGIGCWDYDPWRGTFYPPGLPKLKQLDHASRRVTAIEINATFYKLQNADLYRRWSETTPDGFRFA